MNPRASTVKPFSRRRRFAPTGQSLREGTPVADVVRMKTITRMLLISALYLPIPAFGSEVAVSYLVNESTLKTVPAGTMLAFDLFSDSGCTVLSHSETVAIGGIGVIERIKSLKVRGGPTPPKAARLNHVLSGVAQQASYLRVTGAGVSPLGGSCQPQGNVLQATSSIPCASQTGNEVVFDGCNVTIRSGAGATDNPPNGLGNLVVGYNANLGAHARTGSHNLVVGDEHGYSSYGGLVAGRMNTISGPSASVSGGQLNTASAFGASVSGGHSNVASAVESSVTGGRSNTASGTQGTSVSGGDGNVASGVGAWVAGGSLNIASGNFGAISGGHCNTAGPGPAPACSVVGGHASVGGGFSNVASADSSSVGGGAFNQANGSASSVSGGRNRTATGQDDWIAGALFQDN